MLIIPPAVWKNTVPTGFDYATEIATLETDLTSDGVWAKLDALWVLAADTSANAKKNLVNPGTFDLTEQNSPTFSAQQGYTSNGTTSYLKTGFTPSTAGGNMTAHSGAIGHYSITNRTSGSNQHANMLAAADGTNEIAVYAHAAGPVTYFPCNDHDFNSYGSSNGRGFWVASRKGVSNDRRSLFLNGTEVVTDQVSAEQALVTQEIYMCAVNSSGTPAGFSTDVIAAGFISGGLTATDVSNFSTRLNAYMTAAGCNVY